MNYDTDLSGHRNVVKKYSSRETFSDDTATVSPIAHNGTRGVHQEFLIYPT